VNLHHSGQEEAACTLVEEPATGLSEGKGTVQLHTGY
jgi:hypothetical protein